MENQLLTRYEQAVLKALNHHTATLPKGSQISSSTINTLTQNYLNMHEPGAGPLPHWQRDLGFKSLSGAGGLVEYLEKKNYIKTRGRCFEVVSTKYKPGAPANFRMPTLSRRATADLFASQPSNSSINPYDYDDDSVEISEDHPSSQQLLEGLNEANFSERAANLKRMLSNGSISGSQGHEGSIDLLPGQVACPICGNGVASESINGHVDDCLTKQMLRDEERSHQASTPPVSPSRRKVAKRRRVLDDSGNSNAQLHWADDLVDTVMEPPQAQRIKTAEVEVPRNNNNNKQEDRDPRFAASTLQTSLPSDRECAICLENFEAGNVVATLHCMCMFHKHCVVDWLSRSPSCPNHPDMNLRASMD